MPEAPEEEGSELLPELWSDERESLVPLMLSAPPLP